jgi:mono/diheme cytochrome c family protein
MKGPMTTQTLQDIVGHEPFHWRGDRDGLEEFAGAFVSLQGGDVPPTSTEMAAFKAFLATIAVPPNPFRGPDNALPASLPLPGHFTPGRFGAAGQPLPVGDAVRGLALYRTGGLEGGLFGAQCVTCHTLPTGMGSDMALLSASPLPLGPNGEHHLAIVSVDGGTNVSMKVPHLRTLYDKVGCDLTQTSNRAGFGFLHDGSVDSLARFVAEPLFRVRSDQEVADLVAFLLAFSGGDLPAGTPGSASSRRSRATRTPPSAARWRSPPRLRLPGLLSRRRRAHRREPVAAARRAAGHDRATATLPNRDGDPVSPARVGGRGQQEGPRSRAGSASARRDRDDGFGIAPSRRGQSERARSSP